jgi:hypothetical protein
MVYEASRRVCTGDVDDDGTSGGVWRADGDGFVRRCVEE